MKLTQNTSYQHWLEKLKFSIKQAQYKASLSVNSHLLAFYWLLGKEIKEKQLNSKWGSGFLTQLSQDLINSYPEIKGFSLRNIKYIRQWYSFYNKENELGQQAVAQLKQIPWGHNIAIVSKSNTINEAIYYVTNTINNGWSRSVLVHQIESELWKREGNAISNFSEALPKAQSDLALQTLKDPYVFDFLNLTKTHNEKELEQSLVTHITEFLLELGAGFAYIGKQVALHVGDRDFFLDLLFYHTNLHCYVVIELKTGDFEPEHAGKLNFYIKAVDEQFRKKADEATIGILLCKNKDKLVAEYALSDINKPIGVSSYQLTQSLPENLKSSLPSIEEIEQELANE